MKIIPIALIAALMPAILGSCCSTEQFENRLNTYINRSKIDVVQEFGSPVKTEKFGDTELVTFVRDRTYFDEGEAPSMHTSKVKKKDGSYEYDAYMTQGRPAHYEYRTCEITFRIKNNRVVSWSHRGNDCCD